MKRVVLFILCAVVALSCSKESGSVSTDVQYYRGKTEYYFDGKKIYETISSYSSDVDIDIEVVGSGSDITYAGYFAEMIFPYDEISFHEDGHLYMGGVRWYEYTSSYIMYSDDEIKGLKGKKINYSVNSDSVTFEINYQDAGCRITKVINNKNGTIVGGDGKSHTFVEKVTFKKH